MMKVGFFANSSADLSIRSGVEQEYAALLLGQGTISPSQTDELLEMALASYRVQMKKLFYIEARQRLLKQIHKNLNRRIKKFAGAEHIYASLGSVAISTHTWWVSIVGDLVAYRFFEGKLERLIPERTADELYLGQIKKAKTIKPRETRGEIPQGEIFIVCTIDTVRTLNEKKLNELVSQQIDLSEIAKQVVETALKRRRQAEYAVMLVNKELVKSSPRLQVNPRLQVRLF